MKEYRQKFFWRRIIYSYWNIFILGLIIIFLAQKIFIIYQKYFFTKEKLELVKREEKKISLTESLSISKLDNINSPRGIEEYLRRTYSVKKEGEGVLIIYDTPTVTYNISKQKTLVEEFKEWYNDITEKFKK